MKIDPLSVWSDIQAIKKNSPLVHNITNFVVMEPTANNLLAIGASPVMAHALEEVEEMVGIANSLVLNIGTLSPSWIQSMRIALKAANRKGIPVIFDPVGAGATAYRTETAHSIINLGIVTVIRGNASEILSLYGAKEPTKGVDSVSNASNCIDQAKILASRTKSLVWMSGKTDVITNGHSCILIDNGHPLMGKTTGMGCTATAISGAFLAINQDPLAGCVHAAILMGVAGELAAKNEKGPGSFRLAFTDALYSISLKDIEGHLRCEVL